MNAASLLLSLTNNFVVTNGNGTLVGVGGFA